MQVSGINEESRLFDAVPANRRRWIIPGILAFSLLIGFIALIVGGSAMTASSAVASANIISIPNLVAANRIVSLNSSQLFSQGAGLSLKKTSDLSSGGNVSSLQVVTFRWWRSGNMMMIAGMKDESRGGAVLLVGTVSEEGDVAWLDSTITIVPDFVSIDGIVHLLNGNFVVVYRGSSVVATLDDSTGAFTLVLRPAVKYYSGVTVEPVVKRLSYSTFVVSYFCDSGICATIGRYNAGDSSTYYNTPVTWSNVSHNFHDVAVFNSTSLAFFSTMDNVTQFPSPAAPLSITVASLPLGALTLGPQVVLPSSFLVDNFFDVVALTSSTAVVCLPDAKLQEGLRCVAVRVFSLSQAAIVSSVRLTGFGSDASYQFLRVQRLSELHFAVLANNGGFAFVLCALHGNVLSQIGSALELAPMSSPPVSISVASDVMLTDDVADPKTMPLAKFAVM